MRITGRNGAAVTLQPLRWQFAPDAGDWDDRWLVIKGMVDLDEGSWSFTDPCLLIEEARGLAEWLRAAAEGRIGPEPLKADREPVPSLSFMEPALGFAVAARNGNDLIVRIHFAAEGAPPWRRLDGSYCAHHLAELPISSDQLLAAAGEWSQELNALPARPWVDPG